MSETNLSPERGELQRRPPQSTHSSTQNAGNSVGHHMMPGLVTPIVNTFLTPRKHFTTRGVSKRRGVTESFVNTALFRDLYEQINDLRAMVSGRSMSSETVRDFRRKVAA